MNVAMDENDGVTVGVAEERTGKSWSLRRGVVFLTCAWLAVVLGASIVLWQYKAAPGKASDAPPTWPIASVLPRNPLGPTVIVVAHPRCPCTRATMSELARLMTALQGKATAVVLFVKPAGAPDTWVEGDLWTSASRLPATTVRIDDGGREAKRFGAYVSGATLVYDARGALLFTGGITASRGHEGDNVGRRRIEELIGTGSSDGSKSATFGCALANANNAGRGPDAPQGDAR